MAKCGVTNIGGGGGIGSDEVSATKDNVLSGKTYVGADTSDEIGTGTMADNGVTGNKSINAGGSFLVKKGYHAQDFSVGANSLGSQTPGNASAGYMLSGQTAWVNGNKITGTIPYQNAEVAGTDQIWATNYANGGDGNYFLGIRNGHYLNGVNWVRGYNANFVAANIKKGVNVAGVVGTFEGYVPTATDLYLRGNNIRGWTCGAASFDTGQITLLPVTGRTHYLYVNNLNLTGYSWLNVQGYVNNGANIAKTMRLYHTPTSSSQNLLGYLDVSAYAAGLYAYGFDLTAHQLMGTMEIEMYQMDGAIYRIWLS